MELDESGVQERAGELQILGSVGDELADDQVVRLKTVTYRFARGLCAHARPAAVSPWDTSTSCA